MIRVLGKHFTDCGKAVWGKKLVRKRDFCMKMQEEQQGMCHISSDLKDANGLTRENTLLIFKTHTPQFQRCEHEKKKDMLQNGSFSEFKGCPRIDPLPVLDLNKELWKFNNCIQLIILTLTQQRI